MERTSQIIDRIYAAALDASAWPELIDTLRSLYACRAAGLYAADIERGKVSIFGMQGIDADQIRSYVDHHLLDNPWTTVPELQRQGAIRTERSLDEYYRQPGYYRRSTLFNEWMKPQDFIHTLGTNLLVERGSQIKFFMYRPDQAGYFSGSEVADFSRLSAHLGIALTVARRLDLTETRLDAAMHLVDRLQLGVVFLDACGRLTHANRHARQQFASDSGLRARNGAVCAQRPVDSRRLDRAIASALEVYHGITADAPAMVDVARPGHRPLRVVPVPLPRRPEGPWLESRLAVALVICDPEAEAAIPGEWLQQCYGLTRREAALASCLGQGLSLREAAGINGVTYETARWHLKNIFQKTGTARQADLVRLMLAGQVQMVPVPAALGAPAGREA